LYILHNYTRIKLERFTWERRCSCWIIWCFWLFQVCVVLYIYLWGQCIMLWVIILKMLTALFLLDAAIV